MYNGNKYGKVQFIMDNTEDPVTIYTDGDSANQAVLRTIEIISQLTEHTFNVSASVVNNVYFEGNE